LIAPEYFCVNLRNLRPLCFLIEGKNKAARGKEKRCALIN
jgi:hypothetical protein